jgi:hypothetical protein
MKKVILMLVCVLVTTIAFGQKDEDEKTNTNKGKPIARLDQADRFIVDIFSDIWMNKPADSIMSTSAINRGANAYVMRDFPIAKSNFSFAIGAGISCHNMYSNAWAVRESVADTTQTFGYSFTGKTVFQKLPESVNSVETSYKNNKLTAIYLDVPVEFRFRTKNEGQKFKVALGFKLGYMLSSHMKYRGDDLSWNYSTQSWSLNSDELVKFKSYKVPNVEVYRMGPTLRIGWGWINATAYYSLTNLFKKNKGPEMYPISVGISITPL